MSKYKLLPVCAGIIAAQFFSVPAYSQIEEVVVTARKKSESLQQVPMAITPFTSEMLERRDFTNLEDIAGGTVGLNYSGESSSGFQSSPTLRGLRQGFATDRVSNVAIFLDGVYLSRQSMANMGMIDMERIEVVKGPQNSLYGRNAFAGAINYVTKRPQEEFEAYASTSVGDGGRQDWKFSATGTLVEGVLLGRYTFGESFYDGHSKNDHPNAKIDPPGFTDGGSDGLLGGWDDKTYNFGLTWLIADNMTLDIGYYKTDLKRENQPNYIVSGVREVARFQTTPYGDMNFNEVSLNTAFGDPTGSVLVSTGNTIWKGALPYNHPGKAEWIGGVNEAGVQDFDFGYGNNPDGTTFIPDEDPIQPGIYADPRGFGFVADTEIQTAAYNWDINDAWSLRYTYSNVEHYGIQSGVAERNLLAGSTLSDSGPEEGTVEKPRVDKQIQSNISNSNPELYIDTTAHELIFDYVPNDEWSFKFGGYYSDSNDESWGIVSYNAMCTSEDQLVDQDQDPTLGCLLSLGHDIKDSPLQQSSGIAIYNLFRDTWSTNRNGWTIYDEQVASVFGSAEWAITPDIRLRVEGRYTQEDKEITRKTDSLAIPAGALVTFQGSGDENERYSAICSPGETVSSDGVTPCSASSDEKTFYYFTPKFSVDWQYTEDNMVYFYAANGLKAGGLNNTDDRDQQTYRPEENWTYEIGSKNTLMDGNLQLNAALYYVDWTDLVGGAAPNSPDSNPNASTVQVNVGDVENYGLEIDGQYFIDTNWSVDFGASYTNPRYKDGTSWDPAASKYYSGCQKGDDGLGIRNPDGSLPANTNFDNVIDFTERCGDVDIGGHELLKVSKEQYTYGVNYNYDFESGWGLYARLDGNYQSAQWLTPMNIGSIRSRSLWNTSLNLISPNGQWELNFWGKNITDKEYVSGAFTISIFNKLIVTQGAPARYGATLKYNFL
ncbi:MAG: iron complex outermembrane receptor protein [Oceanicoccus sp.]|jgi:iron complex outermembrane receptor protein